MLFRNHLSCREAHERSRVPTNEEHECELDLCSRRRLEEGTASTCIGIDRSKDRRHEMATIVGSRPAKYVELGGGE